MKELDKIKEHLVAPPLLTTVVEHLVDSSSGDYSWENDNTGAKV